MIDSDELENRQQIGARGPRVPKAFAPAPTVVPLADRLEVARGLTPPDNACRACYRAGRDAAVAALSGEGELEALVAAARRLEPKHYHNGDRSFQAGRDAAIAAVAGA